MGFCGKVSFVLIPARVMFSLFQNAYIYKQKHTKITFYLAF